MAPRNPGVLGVWGPSGTRPLAAESQWKKVESWNRLAEKEGKSHRVFCCSLADVFEDWQGQMTRAASLLQIATRGTDTELTGKSSAGCPEPLWYHPSTDRPIPSYVPPEDYVPYTLTHARMRLFSLIERTPALTYQLVTKRPENIPDFVPYSWREKWPDNAWCITSVEDQETADRRIPHLLRVPARVLGLSVEPLLAPIILHKYFSHCKCGELHGFTACPNTGGVVPTCRKSKCEKLRPKISWSIVGGESGNHYRDCDVAWISHLAKQCQDAGVACWIKQDANRLPGQQGRIPDSLWAIKQFPEERQ